MFDDSIITALLEKHPPLHRLSVPQTPTLDPGGCFVISEAVVLKPIQSFPSGSAGGMHSKEVSSEVCWSSCEGFHERVTWHLVNLVLVQRVELKLLFMLPVFYNCMAMLGFRNAFNSIHRNKMLKCLQPWKI